MDLHPSEWRRFSHDGVNVLDVLLFNLETVWPDQLQKQTLKATQFGELATAVSALRRAVQDVSTLALCDQLAELEWETVDWNQLIAEKLQRLNRRQLGSFDFQTTPSDWRGHTSIVLIERVLDNLAWFSRHFCATPIKVRLGSFEQDSKPWVQLFWSCSFNTPTSLDAEFARFRPFYPMHPQKSLALDETTGLMLCVVRKVAEVQGGRLLSKASDRLELEWICPKVVNQEGCS